MPAHYDKNLTTESAFNLASAMAWANVHYGSITSYVGTPPFHLGAIEFHRAEDLQDRLALSAKKSGVHLHGYKALLTPKFSYVAFKHGNDYLSMMSEINGRHVVAGSDLVVQVTNRDESWHAVAKAIIDDANRTLSKDGSATIKTNKIDDTRTDYVFPSIDEMKAFCLMVERGNIDRLASKHAPGNIALAVK